MAAADSNRRLRARRSSPGGVVERETRTRGTAYDIRFRDPSGRRRSELVGYACEGTRREDAEKALAYVLEQIKRGEWRPPVEPQPVRKVPTFHVFASEWFEAKRTEGGRRGTGLSPAGEADLRWQLCNHLLPAFARKRLDQISVADVDRYRRDKVREGLIGTTSINKTLACLSAILEQAVEYGHVERNPAKGKRRRLPAVKPQRTYLDNVQHVAALLDAAGALDAERENRTRPFRRALLATLALSGVRIDEALSLRWRHLNLAGGRLRVPGTKTAAAERVVPLLPLLRDELLAHKVRRPDAESDALVFGSSRGNKLGATNVRRRVLAPTIERANERLAEQEAEPLPEGLTPHSLRRTCASILVALGWDPARVMRALGHTTAAFTLSVYASAMDMAPGEPERLRALVEGAVAGQREEAAAPSMAT